MWVIMRIHVFFSVRHVVRNKLYVYLTDNPVEDGVRNIAYTCVKNTTHTQNYGHDIQCALSVIHIRRITCL